EHVGPAPVGPVLSDRVQQAAPATAPADPEEDQAAPEQDRQEQVDRLDGPATSASPQVKEHRHPPPRSAVSAVLSVESGVPERPPPKDDPPWPGPPAQGRPIRGRPEAPPAGSPAPRAPRPDRARTAR